MTPASPRTARRGALALAASLVLVVGLAACGSSDDTSSEGTTSTTAKKATTTTTEAGATTGADLEGRTFVSQEVEGHELVPDSTITFTFADNGLSVNAGCNTMNAEYAIADGTLQWTGPAAGTMMACEDALSAQDTWISGLLTDGVEATLDGDTLTLVDGEVTITMVDEESATPDSALVGPTWSLESIIEGEAVSSMPAGAEPPTLVFGDDGRVAVFSGCNTGSGDYTAADDGTVEFGPIMLTRMACKDPAGQLEATVMPILDGTVTMAIDGDQLTLTKGDQGLIYTAG